MANGLIILRADQDWARTATYSATSEQTGYEAAKAGTDDPSEPWWADATSATLTVTLSGTKSVDTVALIMTNAGDGTVIEVEGFGSPTESLIGAREPSGYPRDLLLLRDSPASIGQLRFHIVGNIYKWSIGRVVIGLRDQLSENLLLGVTFTPYRQQYSDEYPDFRHDIRYDIGVEGWHGEGEIISPRPDANTSPLETAQAQLDGIWSSTKGGFLPTLFVPEPTVYPPMWGRFAMSLPRSHSDAPDITRTRLSFTPMSRGREVVG